MFLHVSVILSTGWSLYDVTSCLAAMLILGEAVSCPGGRGLCQGGSLYGDSPGVRKACGVHSTGMISC